MSAQNAEAKRTCDPENNAPMSSKLTSQQGYQSQSMYFFPVTNDEVYNFIAKLKNKQAGTGPSRRKI